MWRLTTAGCQQPIREQVGGAINEEGEDTVSEYADGTGSIQNTETGQYTECTQIQHGTVHTVHIHTHSIDNIQSTQNIVIIGLTGYTKSTQSMKTIHRSDTVHTVHSWGFQSWPTVLLVFQPSCTSSF